MGGQKRDCPICAGVGQITDPVDEIAYLADTALRTIKDAPGVGQIAKEKIKAAVKQVSAQRYDKRTISFKSAKAQLMQSGKTAQEAERLLTNA
jgi:hypothetical protein